MDAFSRHAREGHRKSVVWTSSAVSAKNDTKKSLSTHIFASCVSIAICRNVHNADDLPIFNSMVVHTTREFACIVSREEEEDKWK